jgi:hypothetical protein
VFAWAKDILSHAQLYGGLSHGQPVPILLYRTCPERERERESMCVYVCVCVCVCVSHVDAHAGTDTLMYKYDRETPPE